MGMQCRDFSLQHWLQLYTQFKVRRLYCLLNLTFRLVSESAVPVANSDLVPPSRAEYKILPWCVDASDALFAEPIRTVPISRNISRKMSRWCIASSVGARTARDTKMCTLELRWSGHPVTCARSVSSRPYPVCRPIYSILRYHADKSRTLGDEIVLNSGRRGGCHEWRLRRMK
jgi:hypothetical protein